jgi:hypothetical protein
VIVTASLSALAVDGEGVHFEESLQLGLREFPAECVFLDVAGEVQPPESVSLFVGAEELQFSVVSVLLWRDACSVFAVLLCNHQFGHGAGRY